MTCACSGKVVDDIQILIAKSEVSLTKRPTIDDVARHSGVGRTTVSRVLNNGPNVRDLVRERVMNSVEALGYTVNAQARNLATGLSHHIALIHATDEDAEPNSYYHSGLELGAMRACAENGFSLITQTANPSKPEDQRTIIQQAENGRFDGLILTPPFSDRVDLINAIVATDTPVVCISAGKDTQTLVPWVGINDYEAGQAIGHFLAERGHKCYAYIDGPIDHSSARMRLQGFLEALSHHGLSAQSVRVLQGNFTFRSGVEMAEILLSGGDRPTALVCANDDMAAGALLSAHKLNLAIPADISITGFDDTPVSRIVWPPLTTVHQPIRQFGARAVALLIDCLQGSQGMGDKKPLVSGGYVPFELVERLSTQALPL